MKSGLGFKTALLGSGIGLACVVLYYLRSRWKKEPKDSPIPIERLNAIVQYIKYLYFTVFTEISKAVRKAKEELNYNEDYIAEMRQRSFFYL